MLVWHLLTDSPVGRTRLELEHFAIQYVQFLTALECTKFVSGQGCDPNPAEGSYTAPPDALARLRGTLLLRGREGRGRPPYANSWIRSCA